MDPKDIKLFNLLRSCARNNTRCPPQNQFGALAYRMPNLTKAGYIRIEMFAQNWRVAVILRGPDRGLRTEDRDYPVRKPTMIIYAKGSRYTNTGKIHKEELPEGAPTEEERARVAADVVKQPKPLTDAEYEDYLYMERAL